MDPQRVSWLPFKPLRCTRLELLPQMMPFEVDLASRNIDESRGASVCYPGCIEPVSPLPDTACKTLRYSAMNVAGENCARNRAT